MEPLLLVGPEGAGKAMLIRHLVESRRAPTTTTLHCSAQTTAEHVVQKIRQLCVLQSSATGRVFRPREGDRLVLYLKDINLPRPDKYGTCSLVAFLQQVSPPPLPPSPSLGSDSAPGQVRAAWRR